MAQVKDTTSFTKRISESKTVKKLMGLIRKTPEVELSPFVVKSEDPYLPFEGKIIRQINIRQLGFDNIILDSTRRIQSFFAKAGNRLHINTREAVVRRFLFVREGTPLNPYRLADNERTLRNLDFILDARIYVKPIPASSDSVDLLIVTRDVFSFSGSVSANIPTKYEVGVKDINIGGTGQHAEFQALFNRDRTPVSGYEAFYELNNIKGTFLDATMAYTKLDHGVSIGNENERAVYFKLERALYQPFARMAGSVEWSDNRSENVFQKPDSTFVPYHYIVQDYWMGYSFGYKKLANSLRENRNRKFIAVRSFEQRFLSQFKSDLTEPDRYAYRDRLTFLTELTFFRQDFYKTQYVAGFGRTEDIPYGYRVSVASGWERELGYQRPYSGAKANYNHILPGGTMLSYQLQAGGYLRGKQIEDGLLAADFTRYSKILRIGTMIIRHRYEAGYAALFNQRVKQGIAIRDLDGILGFKPDSLVGLKRLTLGQETILFTPWKLLGFRLAPVVRIDFAFIKLSPGLFQSSNFFSGYSVGIRARNENLILKTVEARFFYYPNTVERVAHFRFNFTSNFRIRYPTNLVNKPSTVFP